MNYNKLDIMMALKANDEAGLRIIFRSYFNKLYSFSVSFVHNQEVSREIVHDAIFNLWERRHNLPHDTNVKAYLYKSVRNMCINHLKKYRNKSIYEISTSDTAFDISLNFEVLIDNDWDKLLTKELDEELNKTIASLPEKCRKVFELSRFNQLSNAEIAECLDISVKTVEGHITDAIKTIRFKISNYLKFIILILNIFYY